MAQPRAGEVWMVDLGLAAKPRPCLLLTDYPADDELTMITVLAHTTALHVPAARLVAQSHFLKKELLTSS